MRKKSIPNRLKAWVVWRDKGICQNCGKQGKIIQYGAVSYPLWRTFEKINGKDVAFEISHILPESAGGQVIIENLILLCRRCNRSLGTNKWIPLNESNNNTNPR